MNAIELKNRAQRLTNRLNVLGFSKNGKPMVIDQAYELVAAEEGFRNQHVLRTKLDGVPGQVVLLSIPRVLDEAFAKAVLVQHTVDTDEDWMHASEAWDFIVEEAAKRAGVEPASDESEQAAELVWAAIIRRMGWDAESENQHLKQFISNNMLMGDLVKYAEAAAADEADMTDLNDLGSADLQETTKILSTDDPFRACKEAGYTVHAPETPITPGWAFCIEGDYAEGFPSEQAAWEAARADHLASTVYSPTLAERDARAMSIADSVFEDHDFGAEVVSCNGWSWTSGEGVFSRAVFLKVADDACNQTHEETSTRKVTFTVTVTCSHGEGSVSGE